jgi:hypothetical protein
MRFGKKKYYYYGMARGDCDGIEEVQAKEKHALTPPPLRLSPPIPSPPSLLLPPLVPECRSLSFIR